MPNRFGRLIAILAGLTLMTALAATPVSADATRVYRLAMSGAEEVCDPPTACGGDGTGEAIVIVNPNNDTVCFLARWRDVDGMIVAAHIHVGADGVAGPVVVPLLGGVSLPGDFQVRGCVDGQDLTDDINANPANYYINFHSTTWPGGALRAQLG